jgi:Na+/H+-dicarboxylate symporter
MKLQTKIFVGLLAGVAVGAVSRTAGLEALRAPLVALEPVGVAFVRLVTMVVVPLVIASLFVGVASLGDIRRLGRVGGKTLGYFLGTTFIGAIVGTAVGLAALRGEPLAAAERAGATLAATKTPTLLDTILAMVPQNPFASASQTDLLPLIISVCIFGAAATVISGAGRQSLLTFFGAVNELCMVVIGWIMVLAPFAVFVLIASLVARLGLDVLQRLLAFSLVVVAALSVHVLITLIPLLRFAARLSVLRFFRDVSDALLFAFSTASSNATLPVSMAAARNRVGVSNEITSFVLPAGATINKNGSAIYKAVTAIFIAQMYGVTLGPAQVVAIVLTSTFAAFAGAGVPGSSLVTTLIVLNAIGLGSQAAAGIALVTSIDRPLDMCRSTVNTIGNLIGTAVIARSEGEALA